MSAKTDIMKEQSDSRWEQIKSKMGGWGLTTYGILAFAFLYLPIVILVIFSFNDARSVSKWSGFTLDWYGKMFKDGQILLSIWNSLFLAIVSTIIATILGTLVALGLERYSFRGKTAVDSMFYLPVIIPDIAMAIMLLLFFNMSGIGFTPWKVNFFGAKLAVPYSVIIGHVAFNTSFVAIVVRARLAQMDRTLEEAASDLYANAWQTFRRVTLPMLMPGIVGGALLAFTLSLDDFVITFFTSGAGFNTLPVRVFGMIKKGVTPKINAVSTLMLAVSLTLVIISILLSRRSGDGDSVQMGF